MFSKNSACENTYYEISILRRVLGSVLSRAIIFCIIFITITIIFNNQLCFADKSSNSENTVFIAQNYKTHSSQSKKRTQKNLEKKKKKKTLESEETELSESTELKPYEIPLIPIEENFLEQTAHEITKLRVAFEANNRQNIEDAVKQLFRVHLNYSITESQTTSELMLLYAKESFEKGKSELAKFFIDWAILFSPSSPSPHWYQCKQAIKHFEPFLCIKHFFIGARKLFRNPYQIELFSSLALSWLLSAIFLFIIIITIVWSYKYGRSFLHHLQHRFSSDFLHLWMIIAAITASAPFLLKSGTFLGCVSLLFLLGYFVRQKERFLLFIIWLFAAIFPFGINLLTKHYLYVESPYHFIQLQQSDRSLDIPHLSVSHFSFSEKKYPELQKWSNYGRAWKLVYLKKSEEGLSLYKKDSQGLIDITALKKDAAVLNSIATLSAIQDNFSDAKKYYLETLKVFPLYIPSLLNMSQLHFLKTEISEGSALYDKVRFLDDYRADTYDKQREILQDNFWIPSEIGASELYHQINDTNFPLQSYYQKYHWNAWLGEGISFDVYIGVVGFFFLLLFIYIFRYTPIKQPKVCTQCGTITCRKCDKSPIHSDYCEACSRIYEKRVSVDPKLKAKKEIEIREYQEWNSRLAYIITVFFFGAGHIIQNFNALGFILIFCWSMSVSWLYLDTRFFLSSEIFEQSSMFLFWILWFFITFMTTITTWWTIINIVKKKKSIVMKE